jgi:ABC-2 type transport system ATP-binding protein
MEEAERLADRIVVMARGEVVAGGAPATLGGRDRAHRASASRSSGMCRERSTTRPRSSASPTGGGGVPSGTEKVTTAAALAHDLPLADLAVRPPTLEDVYLELTR